MDKVLLRGLEKITKAVRLFQLVEKVAYRLKNRCALFKGKVIQRKIKKCAARGSKWGFAPNPTSFCTKRKRKSIPRDARFLSLRSEFFDSL